VGATSALSPSARIGSLGDVIDGDGSFPPGMFLVSSRAARGDCMWQDTLTVLRRCGGLSLNVLILGSVTAEQRDEVLDELRTAAGRDDIVVIDQLVDLSTAEQQALLRWLDRHRDAMVLSFASNAIFRLMTDGKFSERLFYRLNSITLSVDEETA
jgi:hypothetical protein